MPYTITTKDGIAVDGIPDDVAKDDQRLKDLVNKLRAAGTKAGTFADTTVTPPTETTAPMTPMPVASSPMSRTEILGAAEVQPVTTPPQPSAGATTLGGFVKDAFGSVGKLRTVLEPVDTAIASVLPSQTDMDVATRGVVGGLASPVTILPDVSATIHNLLFPSDTKQSLMGTELQNVLSKLGVKEAETKAQQIMQVGVQAMTAGAANILTGSAMKAAPGVIGKVGEALAAQPVQQLVGGALGGTASESAAALGAPTWAQFVAGLVGGAVGAGAAGIRKVPSPKGPYSEAEDIGVTLMTSDVRPPKTMPGKLVQTAGELLGTSGKRQRQQVERVAAVKDMVRRYDAEDLGVSSDAVAQDLLTKRSADLDKWVTAKTEVIDKLSNSDPVVSKIKGQDQTRSERINDLATMEMNKYIKPAQQKELNRLREEVKIANVVPMSATNKKIDETIAYLNKLSPDMNAPVIKTLTLWKEALKNQDLVNIETLRKQVGDAFASPELASVRSTGEKALASIYPAVKEDMSNYIKAYGGEADLTKWEVANKELSKMADELDLSVLKRVLNKGEATPELIRSLLFNKDKSTVQTLYNGLSDKGQAAARAAIIAKAVVAGTNEAGEISPDKFTSAVAKLGAQTGVFFKGEDLKVLTGLKRVLDYTARAGVPQTKPPTGLKATLMLPVSAAALASIFGGGMKGFALTVGAGATIGGMARVYESKAVRDLLSKLPMLKQGSPEEAHLLKRILAAAQAVTASSSMRATQDNKTSPIFTATESDPSPHWHLPGSETELTVAQ